MPPALSSRWADMPSSSEPSLAPSPVNGAAPTPSSSSSSSSSSTAAAAAKKQEESIPPKETEASGKNTTDDGTNSNTTSKSNGIVANHLLSAPARTNPSTRSSSPNVRTTIKWQKRNVIIQIPSDSPWGYPEEEGGRPYPLTSEEVEKRFQHWRDLGYNVDVISNGDDYQIREIYPEEKRGKVEASEIFVSIPDRRDWEAYCEALREEKLRALGVFDEPAIPSPVAAFRDSPLPVLASPAVDAINPFTPPSQPASAMSNPHNAFSPFAPVSVPATGTPGPATMSPGFHGAPHHLAFHLPRSSMSMSGTPPAHEGSWDSFPTNLSPPIPRQTPPMSGPTSNPGIWGTPTFGGMRNGSPMGVHGHSQSVSYFNPQYPGGEPYGEYHPVHGLVGQERSFQQGMRRGSPLARGAHGSSASISPVGQRRNIWAIPEPPMSQDGPAIDAPVPKHRHQLSLTLQKEYENQEGYQHDDSRKYHNQHIEVPEEGFNTNPVSPAPPLNFPEAPDMPAVETDVHNGPELMSNPEDDVSDEEEEKSKNKQDSAARQTLEYAQDGFATDPNTPLHMPDANESSQYIPHSQYAPHSRQHSLSQRQMEFDQHDPIQHSAMSMLMAGEGLGGSGMNPIRRDEDALSDAARTNISDIVTNPSAPGTPDRKYSNATTHAAWLSDHAPKSNAPSSASAPVSKPKFNPAASEFDPTKSITFNPSKITPFTPGNQQPPAPAAQEQQSAQQTSFGSFGAGFNVAAATFQPTLAHSGLAGYLEKGAAAFSPSAPEFTPSWTKPAGDIFSEVVPPAPEKKFVPIVKPSSRDGENAVDEDRETYNLGRRKRVQQVRDDGDDVPQFETPAAQPEGKKETEEKQDEVLSPIEKTAGQSDHEADTSIDQALHSQEAYEFKSQSDAERFAVAAPTEDFLPASKKSPPKALSVPSRTESPEGTKIQDTPSPQPIHMDPQPEASAPEETSGTATPSHQDRPSAQEFNFEFKSASPQKKPLSLSESRYAHSLSPPPSMPAPAPPITPGGFMPPLPEPQLDDEPEEDPEKADLYGEQTPMKKPTDQELDDVFMYMDQASELGVVRVETEHDDGTVVTEDVVVDAQPTPHRLQVLRSANPSPSPRRAEQAAYRHRAASFSPDDDSHGDDAAPAIYSQPDNAFVNNLNDIGVARDEIDSDWNDMLSDSGSAKLRPQSRLFFDTHVEELVGGLFQRRLEPVLRSLAKMNEQITMLSLMNPSKPATELAHSDADDEEEEEDGEGTKQFPPPRSPRDRKLEKIKAAVAEVMLAKNEDGLSEKAVKELKELVLANKHDGDFARIEQMLKESFAAVPRAEELEVLRASVENMAERVGDSQPQPVDELRELLIDTLGKTAQAEDIAVLRHTLRDVVAHSAQKTDLMEMNAIVEEIATKMAVRADVADTKEVLLHAVSQSARKEDLIPIHSILAEAFSKAAKSEDLINLKMVLNEIMNAVLGIDLNVVRQEVQMVSQETAAARHVLGEVIRVAQDNAENFEHRHNSQLHSTQEQHTAVIQRLADINAMIRESHKFQQSRASKTDMRRNLAEKELREENLATRNAVLETHKTVRDGFQDLNNIQPTIEDIRLAVGNLEATQPKLGDFCDGVLESIAQLPTFSQLEEVVRQYAGIEKFRHLMDEDRAHKVELFRNAIDEVSRNQPTIEDMRTMMEEVVAKQQMFVPINMAPSANDEEVEELKKKLDDALRAQTHNEHRADEEFRSKMHWQEKAIELEAKLKLAEEEAARLKESAEEKDAHLKAIEEKRHQTLTSAQMRSALLEGAHQSLQKSVGELSAKNAALEGAVKEAHETEERHKEIAAKMEEENRELRRHIETLRAETEESIRVRERFREKFDKVQEDMRKVSLEITAEQQAWRQQQQEMEARSDVLAARLAAEVSKSQGLEEEVNRLQSAEKDAIRLRVELESIQRNAAKQDESISQLRMENESFKITNARLEQDMESARQNAQQELERLSAAMGTEIQAANAEAAAARSTLEKQLEEIREEMRRADEAAAEEKENIRQSSSEAIEAHLNQLEELRAQHDREIKELTDKHSATLSDLKHRYESKLASTTAKQERAFKHVTEDAEREQYFLQQKLSIAQTESTHLKEHIASLQSQLHSLSENFKIANQAAQAAASAATTVKEMSTPHLSDERALRESLTVLQAQLQEREARIEELEAQLAGFDKEKIKQTEGQLIMYREICEMRIDDLEEIIHSCSLPHVDRGQLRDAATRLKASLDMQFQDTERTIAANSTPSKPSPSSAATAVTPAAAAAAASLAAKLPGVASAAWANWRKSAAPSPAPAPQSNIPANGNNDSRPASSASNFLNGIMTPPTSRTPVHQQPRPPFIGRAEPQFSAARRGRERGQSSASAVTENRYAPRSGSALAGGSGYGGSGYSAMRGHGLFNRREYDPDADADEEERDAEREGSVAGSFTSASGIGRGYYDQDDEPRFL